MEYVLLPAFISLNVTYSVIITMTEVKSLELFINELMPPLSEPEGVTDLT